MKPYILLDLICPDRGALMQWEIAAFLMFPEHPHQAQVDMPSSLLQVAPAPLVDVSYQEAHAFGTEMLGRARQLGIELFFSPECKRTFDQLYNWK